jgi:hypothetical protein
MMAARTKAKGKAALPPLEPKPAGSRDILPPLTDGEVKNGWSAPELDAYLRGLCNGDAYSYRYEILGRWRDQERIAGEAVAKFKREHDLGDPHEKTQLDRLELHSAHCRAMATRAAEHLEGEQL